MWDRQDHGPSGTSTSDSRNFFEAPPPPEIPETLRRQGHYRQVTGEDELGETRSPDRSKVKNIFPWEDKPRHMPERIFPSADAPSPSSFINTVTSPEPQTLSPPTPSRAQTLSPLHGLPVTLTYANAWDSVPSIQKYASRLVRPPPAPASLTPAFDDEAWRRRSWDERVEASSRDGDDEDEGDDDDEAPAERTWDDDDSAKESKKSSPRGGRSRSGSSVSSSYTIKGRKKEYRVRGVQTVSRELRSQGIQVTIDSPKGTPPQDKKFSRQGSKRQSTTSTPAYLGPMTIHAGPDLSMTTAFPSPTNPASPREVTFGGSPTVALLPAAQLATPPGRSLVKTSSPSVARQTSNDGSLTSLTSPPSSVGPLSPPEGHQLLSPRKGERVWDPARGVELFKRGSEEVLARFLRMGSWEEENAQ